VGVAKELRDHKGNDDIRPEKYNKKEKFMGNKEKETQQSQEQNEAAVEENVATPTLRSFCQFLPF
jgi:hypothetical protein